MNEKIDLRGIPCPANAAKALLKIATMSDGQTLEILVDDGEPVENVCASIIEDGHDLLTKDQINIVGWRVVVCVGGGST